MANERAINVSQATQIARSVKGQLTDINGRLQELDERVAALEAGGESEVEVFDATEF